MATVRSQPPAARRGKEQEEEEIPWFLIGRFLLFSWPAILAGGIAGLGVFALSGGSRIFAAAIITILGIASVALRGGRRRWVWVWHHSWGGLRVRLDWERVCEIHGWRPAKLKGVVHGPGWVRFSARVPLRHEPQALFDAAAAIASALEVESVVIRDGDRPGWVEVVIER